MNLTLFTEELRECLNAAGLSDCGENDEWNYWYQRLLKAHSESVERQIMTGQAENDKLRELCGEMLLYIAYPYVCVRPSVLVERARDLGIEVDG